jgi:hypothetical protein
MWSYDDDLLCCPYKSRLDSFMNTCTHGVSSHHTGFVVANNPPKEVLRSASEFRFQTKAKAQGHELGNKRACQIRRGAGCQPAAERYR